MGLDLLHFKLIATPVNSQDFFYLDELDGLPGMAGNLAHLAINLVEATDYFTIHIFQAEKYKNYHIDQFGGNQDSNAYLIGNLDELTAQISGIETEYHLDPAARSVIDSQIRDNTDPASPYIFSIQISYPVAFSRRLVVYHQEIGYQRKGMNRQFYTDFGNCQLYFRHADVQRAARYLDIDYRPDVAEHFKNFFVDNFVEGESIFFPTW